MSQGKYYNSNGDTVYLNVFDSEGTKTVVHGDLTNQIVQIYEPGSQGSRGEQGTPGVTTIAQFTVLMNEYNAALNSYLTNEEAFNALGVGKEYLYQSGSMEGQQGTKMITYTP